jgi:hypothetical protein
MGRAICPICSRLLEGDFQKLTQHVSKCSRGKVKKPKPEAEETGSDIRAMPVLPISFDLKRELTSQNGNLGRHWAIKNREVKEWTCLLTPLVGAAGLNSRKLEWSSWLIERKFAGRRREFDYGNLVGGCKHLIDALVNLGVIYDDAPKYLTVEYRQSKVPDGEAGTIITLLEARP